MLVSYWFSFNSLLILILLVTNYQITNVCFYIQRVISCALCFLYYCVFYSQSQLL